MKTVKKIKTKIKIKMKTVQNVNMLKNVKNVNFIEYFVSLDANKNPVSFPFYVCSHM